MNENKFYSYHPSGKPKFVLKNGKVASIDEVLWVVRFVRNACRLPYGTQFNEEEVEILKDMLDSDEFKAFIVISQ